MIRVRVGKSKGVKRLDHYIKKVIDDITDDIYDELRAETPVDTGFARGSWFKRFGRSVNRVENTAPYAERLDKGHSSQAKDGMTKPAIETIKQNALKGKYRKRNRR